jgi:hypothetical protein
VISPQLRQLVDLSNNAFAGLKENADTLGPRHAKYVFAWPVFLSSSFFFSTFSSVVLTRARFLAMYIGICLRTTFDNITFGEKGLLALTPVDVTCVVPSNACPHNVVVMACAGSVNVVRIDNCSARFCSADGLHQVSSRPHHIMGK